MSAFGRNSNSRLCGSTVWAILAAILLCFTLAQTTPATAQEGSYGLKIYHVNSAFYPFIQVYFRTFDQNMEPLVNLNERNLGLMVKGRAYDPMKRQYSIQSLR